MLPLQTDLNLNIVQKGAKYSKTKIRMIICLQYLTIFEYSRIVVNALQWTIRQQCNTHIYGESNIAKSSDLSNMLL
jgi:ABC-type molybdenum transport system ATPase subunit/photorepair protein PhrA